MLFEHLGKGFVLAVLLAALVFGGWWVRNANRDHHYLNDPILTNGMSRKDVLDYVIGAELRRAQQPAPRGH